MRVYCTRPEHPDDDSRWNEIPDNLIRAGTVSELDNPDNSQVHTQLLIEQRCQTCGMPLVLDNGRFVPIEKIGSGGFGRTFLALDRQFFCNPGQPLYEEPKRAIKQFRAEKFLLADTLEKAMDAFTAERIADSLTHTGIPRAYSFFKVRVDSFDSDNTSLQNSSQQKKYYYLAQEYIEGQNLQQKQEERLKNGEFFSEEEVVEILRQILDILRYLHSKGILHLDIKPSNIIASRENDRDKFFLIDFGGAKRLISTPGQSTPQCQPLISSAVFSPPEQHNGLASYPSDLYALAITCVSLLTGKLVIKNNSLSPNDLRSYNIPHNLERWQQEAQVSPKLNSILNKMLAPDMENRYQSAADVLKEIDSKEKNGSGEPGNGTKWYVKYKKIIIGGIVVVAVLALIPGSPIPKIWSVIPSPPTPSPTSSPEDCSISESVKIDGSTAIGPLTTELIKEFNKMCKNIAIDNRSGGSKIGLERLDGNDIDIAAYSEAARDSDLSKYGKIDNLGRGKIAVAVGRSNPYKGGIALDKLAEIFAGTQLSLGNPPTSLRVINRNKTSGTRGAFENVVLEPRGKKFCSESPSCTEAPYDNTNEILRNLGEDGISYGPYPEICLSPGVARIVPIDGKLPNDPNYPIEQSLLYLYRRDVKTANPAAHKFIEYVQTSQEAKNIINKFLTGGYCKSP